MPFNGSQERYRWMLVESVHPRGTVKSLAHRDRAIEAPLPGFDCLTTVALSQRAYPPKKAWKGVFRMAGAPGSVTPK